VGSALAGSTEFVERARRFRKLFGGGMRQVGIIAAGAHHALAHNRERLADDHAHAQKLASGLSEIPGIEMEPDEVQTNMVYFDVQGLSATQVVEALGARKVWVLATGEQTLRAVTSLAVGADDIDRVIEAVRSIMTE
jgi:threonine aldolase